MPQSDIQYKGRAITITTSVRAHLYVKSPEGESWFVDLPAEIVGFDPMARGPIIRLDTKPLDEAFEEAAAHGAFEREATQRRKEAACEAEGHVPEPGGWCARCGAMPSEVAKAAGRSSSAGRHS